MEKLLVFFVLALFANGVVSRPQSANNGDLNDRFGTVVIVDENGNIKQILPGNQLPGWNRPLLPNQQGQQPIPTTVAPVTLGSVTTSSAMRDCVRNCPVTSEYNPVCGTDNIVYQNPGRLQCARDCGVNVTLLRTAPCPLATPAPSN